MNEPKNFASDEEADSTETNNFFWRVIAPLLVVIFTVLIYLAIK
jgi:hypothetical protein